VREPTAKMPELEVLNSVLEIIRYFLSLRSHHHFRSLRFWGPRWGSCIHDLPPRQFVGFLLSTIAVLADELTCKYLKAKSNESLINCAGRLESETSDRIVNSSNGRPTY